MHSVKTNLKAILYDFGGVFCESPLAKFTAFESEHGLPPQFLANTIKAQPNHGAFGRFECGVTSLAEFDRAFLLETTRAGHAVSGQTLMSLMQLPLRPAVAQHHRSLIDAGFKTACITNNTPNSRASNWVPADSKALSECILSAFDVVIESAAEGIRKPDPAIYLLACQRLSIHPSECVFLDDLGVNLKPARALGMHTIKVPVYDWHLAFESLGKITGVRFN